MVIILFKKRLNKYIIEIDKMIIICSRIEYGTADSYYKASVLQESFKSHDKEVPRPGMGDTPSTVSYTLYTRQNVCL